MDRPTCDYLTSTFDTYYVHTLPVVGWLASSFLSEVGRPTATCLYLHSKTQLRTFRVGYTRIFFAHPSQQTHGRSSERSSVGVLRRQSFHKLPMTLRNCPRIRILSTSTIRVTSTRNVEGEPFEASTDTFGKRALPCSVGHRTPRTGPTITLHEYIILPRIFLVLYR